MGQGGSGGPQQPPSSSPGPWTIYQPDIEWKHFTLRQADGAHTCKRCNCYASACLHGLARAVHPLLPAPGAQLARNLCLCSAKCTFVQRLKLAQPALCQDSPEEERAPRLCAHSPACHLSPSAVQHNHQQHQAVVPFAKCTPGASKAECEQQKWVLEEAGWACRGPRNDVLQHGILTAILPDAIIRRFLAYVYVRNLSMTHPWF